MKPATKVLTFLALFSAAVAVASVLYLKRTKQAVERVVKPVDLSAPDLFPADALLYAEFHGWEKSHAKVEAWWKRFESTATWLALKRGWEKEKLGLPPDLVKALDTIDEELNRAEQKFGHRPTARDFFETYGRHVAFGLIPAPKGERPRLLLATRLPEEGTSALLQKSLGNAGGVRPCDPPLHRGFPVFREDRGGEIPTIFYGVGRGYLFISDNVATLQQGLDRLAVATDGTDPKKPAGTLAGDAVLRRVQPDPGKDGTGIFYLKRDQKFGEWKPELASIDEYVRNAFVLAPKDDAVAFATPEGDRAIARCSFSVAPAQPWTKSLPAGLVQLEATIGAAAGEARKRHEADAKAFFAKPLWKELDAFLDDPARVKSFLDEAIPPPVRPDDPTLARIPNDVRFVGAWFRSAIDSVVGASGLEFMYASKTYPGTDGETVAQFAAGIDVDPFMAFMIAGGLDFGRSRAPEWITREERPGLLKWSLNMDRALKELREDAPPDGVKMVEDMYGHLAPSLLLTGNRIVLAFGPNLAKETAAVLSGGGAGSLEEDPLFREARDLVKPGYSYLSWERPAERLKAQWESWSRMLDTILKQGALREGGEAAEILGAAIETVDWMIGWVKPTRATLSASYPDAARPYESVELMDPEAEKKVPLLVPADAPARTPGFLPADTWGVVMQRLELRPAYDAMRKTFVGALPEGEEQMKKLLPQDDEELQAFGNAVADGIVRNVRGEVGFAVALPHPPKAEPGPPNLRTVMARAPAFIGFAEFEKPDEAFEAIRVVLARVHRVLNPEPFRKRLQARMEWEDLPFGTEMKVGKTGEHSAMALDVFIPVGQEYLVLSLCVLEHSGRIFVTNSPDALKFLGGVKENDAGTLAARLAKALPAATVPEKVSSLNLFHGDSLVGQVRMYLDMVVPGLAGLTLAGHEGPPPQERLQAHLEGWNKWIDLALDLFRSGSWTVGSTARSGNVVRTVRVVVPERKD
jgi:hypothetical protein